MEKTTNNRYQKAVDDFLGPDDSLDKTTLKESLSTDEKRKRLRAAQNVNRGHPQKGEHREPLKQINVSCLHTVGETFTEISLKTGKTKRALMEEAIKILDRRYARYLGTS